MAVEAQAVEDDLPEPDASKAEDEDGAAPAEGKRRFALPDFRKMNKLVLAGIGGGALIVIGAVAYLLFFAGGVADEAAQADAHGAPVAIPIYFLDLPPMVVNIAPEGETEHFLRLTISLEVADAGVAAQIQPFLPRVLDAFQVYLRELRMSDLEGSAGIYQLKEELRRRINIAVHPAVVDAILFREILVQ